MNDRNYESRWWAYIYDQWWIDGRRDAFERDFAFYPLQLADVKGRVLECACGTGAVMLPLMAQGFEAEPLGGHHDLVTTVGPMSGIQPGERLSLEGRWLHHLKFGLQFQASRYTSRLPASADAIKRYLSSNRVKGIVCRSDGGVQRNDPAVYPRSPGCWETLS